jgi:hypothetical protein
MNSLYISICDCKKCKIIQEQHTIIDKLHLRLEENLNKSQLLNDNLSKDIQLLEQKNNVLICVLSIQIEICLIAKIYNL